MQLTPSRTAFTFDHDQCIFIPVQSRFLKAQLILFSLGLNPLYYVHKIHFRIDLRARAVPF